jgi:hypothetical protein
MRTCVTTTRNGCRYFCHFLGCDLEKRQAELDTQAQAMKKNGSSQNEKYYDIDWQASIRFMENCVGLLNSTKSPFNCGIYLEGKPPKIVRDLSAKYEKKVRTREEFSFRNLPMCLDPDG